MSLATQERFLRRGQLAEVQQRLRSLALTIQGEMQIVRLNIDPLAGRAYEKMHVEAASEAMARLDDAVREYRDLKEQEAELQEALGG